MRRFLVVVATAAAVRLGRPTAPRTFLRRQGQCTRRQKAALRELWPRFGVDVAWNETIAPADLFARAARACWTSGSATARVSRVWRRDGLIQTTWAWRSIGRAWRRRCYAGRGGRQKRQDLPHRRRRPPGVTHSSRTVFRRGLRLLPGPVDEERLEQRRARDGWLR